MRILTPTPQLGDKHLSPDRATEGDSDDQGWGTWMPGGQMGQEEIRPLTKGSPEGSENYNLKKAQQGPVVKYSFKSRQPLIF